jgi:outer membrane biosynthesis protein TonB
MSDNQPGARRSVKLRLREKPRRNRAWRFILITLGSGALAAIIATLIAALPTAGSVIFRSDGPTAIQASALFPLPRPVHQVVNVNDPPPREAPRPPAAQPTHPPKPTESPKPPQPTSSPRPSPPPDD